MALETDIDSADYGIGHMSGVALAKTDITLNDEQVLARGIEAFESMRVGVSETPLSQVLNRALFLRGHLDGFHNHKEGIA